MSDSGQEIEAKFCVLHLETIRTRLHSFQARLIQPRVLETNLRFDLPDGSLQADGRVLRLRRDATSRLTYKGPGHKSDGVLQREEIEFMVDDFEKARGFLEALGYHQTILYEKYRATFELDDTLIMLDELPYGDFVEIEGESARRIRATADRLGLDWNASISMSYTALFDVVARNLQLSFRDISFAQFEDVQVDPDDLHVKAADR